MVAIKNVTFNEPFFQGHFPGHSVMPGVLIIEAMAQAAGLLTQLSNRMKGNTGSPLFYLAKVDNARFNAVVTPGDQLRMEVTQKRLHARHGPVRRARTGRRQGSGQLRIDVRREDR